MAISRIRLAHGPIPTGPIPTGQALGRVNASEDDIAGPNLTDSRIASERSNSYSRVEAAGSISIASEA